jgi:hypothetical protein
LENLEIRGMSIKQNNVESTPTTTAMNPLLIATFTFWIDDMATTTGMYMLLQKRIPDSDS